MKIRGALQTDAKAIAEIYNVDLGYETDEKQIFDRLGKIDENREAVFVAETDEKVVGALHIEKYSTLYYKDIANILSLAVRGKHRRGGVGKALISAAESWAKSKNLQEIRLESSMHRKPAHEFYRAMGFDSEKEQIRFLKKL